MANRIREIRISRNMTQTELGNLVGVSQPYIHDLELGRRGARLETLQLIAKALCVEVDELKNTDTVA